METAVQRVLRVVDVESRNLSPESYIALLNEIESDIESRKECLRDEQGAEWFSEHRLD